MSYLSSFFGGGSSGSSGYTSQPAVTPYSTPSSVSMPLTSSSLGLGNSFSPSQPSFSNLSTAGTVAAFDSASSLMSPGLSIGVLEGLNLSAASWDAITRESSSYAPPAEKPSLLSQMSEGTSNFFSGLSDILAPSAYGGDVVVPPVAPVEPASPTPSSPSASSESSVGQSNTLANHSLENFLAQSSGSGDVYNPPAASRAPAPATIVPTKYDPSLSASDRTRMSADSAYENGISILNADHTLSAADRQQQAGMLAERRDFAYQRADTSERAEAEKAEKNLMADISVKQGEAAVGAVLASAANKHNLSEDAQKNDNVALGVARLNKLAADVVTKKAAADKYPPGPARAAAYTAVTAAVNEYNMYRDTVGSMKIRGGVLWLQTGTADQGLTEVDWLGAAGAISLISPFVMFGLEQMAAKDREDRLMRFQMDMREQDRAHDIEMLNIRGEQQLALQGAVNEGSGGGSTASSANINLGGAFSG